MAFGPTEIEELYSQVESHVKATGRFDKVNRHEPKNPPGKKIVAAVWVDRVQPIRQSGLAATTILVVFTIRCYQTMLTEPQDTIDPELMKAMAAVLERLHGDLALGGDSDVRNIEVIGSNSPGLTTHSGYVEMGGRQMFRVFDIACPVVVNDAWVQAY
ncbi:MAG: hypothetical protein S0880_10265 [Actinomycetota bacterium]|nr:hypothetical protein [Actinomycetota bacterium]